MIIYNARIYTVDSQFSIVDSVLIKDGRFIETGKSDILLSKYQDEPKFDLKGKYVFPGLNDAHCHFLRYGLNLRNPDLTNTSSFGEIIDILKDFHKKNPSEWIFGEGWDQNQWETKDWPDIKDLDKAFPNTPVLLIRIDTHAALANSEALKRARVNKNRKIIGGNIISKNDNPPGILIDNAIPLVKKAIPEPEYEDIKNALLNAQDRCFAVGLTSVTDAGLDMENIDHMDSLHTAGNFRMKINAMINPTTRNFRKYMDNGIYKTGRLNVSSVKLFTDGALGSRGALLLEPYDDDPGNFGLLVNSEEYLKSICEKVYNKGYQACTHCIGDKATRIMLNIYGDILKAPNDLRWRIEHAQILQQEDLHKFGKYSIVPSVQTTHATSDMFWAEERLGKKRMKRSYMYKDLLKQNGWIANGSDFPVESINPIHGFYSAVKRQNINGKPESGFQTENAITREEALKAMTIWPAFACFEEKEKGSIEPGKYADFVVTNMDLMEMTQADFSQFKILKTYINGEEVYSL